MEGSPILTKEKNENNNKQMENGDNNQIYQLSSLNELQDKENECNIFLQKNARKKKINKLMNHKSNLSIQNQPRRRLMSSIDKKNELNISGDIIASNSVILRYEDVSQTKKEMKDYLKRVEIFTNRLKTLKKQENELSTKMAIMQKKEKTIEEIKKSKIKLKEVLNKTKTNMKQEKVAKKEQVMLQKLEELDKLAKVKRLLKEKKKQSTEQYKVHQSLIKCMISQTNTKAETLNKYKYLQIKEGYAQYQTEELYKNTEKEELKKTIFMKTITKDKKVILSLKDKCNELEKLEEKCFEKLKTTKIQTRQLQFKADPIYNSNIKSKVNSSKNSTKSIFVQQNNSKKKLNQQNIVKANSEKNVLKEDNNNKPKEKRDKGYRTVNKKKICNKWKGLKKDISKPHQVSSLSTKSTISKVNDQLRNHNTITSRTKRNSVDEKTLLRTLDYIRSLSINKNNIHRLKINSARTSQNTAFE